MCKVGNQAQLSSSEPGVGAHGSHRVQGHQRGAASVFQSCATLAEPTGYAVAIGSKLPNKINGLTCSNKFLMDHVFVVEEDDQQYLTLDFSRQIFFGCS